MLELHTLPKVVTKKSRRIGRGGNRGKNSGLGNKGQNKRAGKTRLGFEGGQKSIIRRTPKMRGFGNTYGFGGKDQRQLSVLTLSAIEKVFADGETVSLETLKNKGLIDEKTKKVRIINTGTLTKKLVVEDSESLYLTAGARKAF